MGYCTSFVGEFQIDRHLEEHHLNYLKKLSETRRMRRDEAITESLPDDIRKAVGLPVGAEGEFFVGLDDDGVLDQNEPPNAQPDVWCCWTPDSTGKQIVWSGIDKPYGFQKWLDYIISSFLNPWNYKLSGEVGWMGEDYLDSGVLTVQNNSIEVVKLHNNRNTQIAKEVINYLEVIANKSQSSGDRKKAVERIVTDITADTELFLYLPIFNILVDSIVEDESSTVAETAAESLNTLLDRGLEIPGYMIRSLLILDFSHKPSKVVELVKRVKKPIIEKYGELPRQPARKVAPYVKPFALYWKEDSLVVVAAPGNQFKLTYEQTKNFEKFLSEIIAGKVADEEISIESEGSCLKFSKNSFFIQIRDGLNVSNSFYSADDSYDPCFDALLRGLKKALELFKSEKSCSEDTLLNSPQSD